MSEVPPTIADLGAGRTGSPPGTVQDAPQVAGGTIQDPPLPGARPGPADAFSSRFNLPPPLADRFVIVGDLSTSGAEADLVIARERSTGEERVIKLYRSRDDIDDAMLSSIRAADPAHVVRVFEVDNFHGRWWEIQEHVHGGSLHDLVLEEGSLPPDRVRAILDDLIEAVAHVHALRIVHRDLKPSNVLLRSRDPLDVVIADFGLATVINASREMRSGSRTPAYAAPEAAWGDISVGRDWWSLGMLILELSTGEHPFRRATGWLEDAEIGRELSTRSIDVSRVEDDHLRTLLRGLLTRDPAKRWGLTEIRKWQQGESPAVHSDDDSELGQPQKLRPFPFIRTNYTDPATLAAAFAAEWNATAELLLGREIEELEDWLRSGRRSDQIDRALEALSEERWQVDRRIANLIAALAPSLSPPVFKGYDISHDGLRALAAAAIAGSAPERQVIEDLQSSRALRAYAGIADHEDYALAAREWERAAEYLATAYDRFRVTVRDVAELDRIDAAAGTLLAIIDRDERAQLNDAADRASHGPAMERPWYAALVAEQVTDDERVGWLWLRVNAAAVAEVEREAQLAVEAEERRISEERRLEAEQEEIERQVAAQTASRRALDRVVAFVVLAAIGSVVTPYAIGRWIWDDKRVELVDRLPAAVVTITGLDAETGSHPLAPAMVGGGASLLLLAFGAYLLIPRRGAPLDRLACGVAIVVVAGSGAFVVAPNVMDSAAEDVLGDAEYRPPSHEQMAMELGGFCIRHWQKPLTVVVAGADCDVIRVYEGQNLLPYFNTVPYSLARSVEELGIYGDVLVFVSRSGSRPFDSVERLAAIEFSTMRMRWAMQCPRDADVIDEWEFAGASGPSPYVTTNVRLDGVAEYVRIWCRSGSGEEIYVNPTTGAIL